MKLTKEEKGMVVAAAKGLYAASKTDDERLVHADTILRLETLDELDKVTKPFVTMLTDKVLERTERILASGKLAEEAHLRASVVKEVYEGIKTKLKGSKSDEQSEQ